MTIFAHLAQIRDGLRRTRHSIDAIEQMNALPRELQRDIGWTLDSRARASAVCNSW